MRDLRPWLIDGHNVIAFLKGEAEYLCKRKLDADKQGNQDYREYLRGGQEVVERIIRDLEREYEGRDEHDCSC